MPVVSTQSWPPLDVLLFAMSDNHFFMEQELCNGMLNDRVVDKAHKKREPKHWQSEHARTESVVGDGGAKGAEMQPSTRESDEQGADDDASATHAHQDDSEED